MLHHGSATHGQRRPTLGFILVPRCNTQGLAQVVLVQALQMSVHPLSVISCNHDGIQLGGIPHRRNVEPNGSGKPHHQRLIDGCLRQMGVVIHRRLDDVARWSVLQRDRHCTRRRNEYCHLVLRSWQRYAGLATSQVERNAT